MSRRRNIALLWPLALLVMAGFCALGAWQLGRMQQKQAMLDAVGQVLALRVPRPLGLAADATRSRDYDWAAGSGHFVDAPAVLLDNQQHAGRAGVRAYRVFQPSAAGAAPLLVELGWLPLPGDRRLPEVPRPAGELRVAGLLAPPPSHGVMAAVVARHGDVLLATGLDAPRLARGLRQASLAARVLKLDPALPPDYARDLDILPNTLTPARHLGYAVQWFALAATVLVVAVVLTLKSKRSKE